MKTKIASKSARAGLARHKQPKKFARFVQIDLRSTETDEKVGELQLAILPDGKKLKMQPPGDPLVKLHRCQVARMLRSWRKAGKQYTDQATDSIAAAFKWILIKGLQEGGAR